MPLAQKLVANPACGPVANVWEHMYVASSLAAACSLACAYAAERFGVFFDSGPWLPQLMSQLEALFLVV